MPAHPEHWSVAERFTYEFDGTVNHLQKFHMVYAIGAIAFVLIVSAITWARTDASAADLPTIILASVIHLLRGVAIVSLFFAWLGSKFIQDWLYARTSKAWISRESSRRPGVSFLVPHWRFFVPAAMARFVIFSLWVGSLFLLLYVFPSCISELERFTPDNFPF